jgi:dTMP kinase
VAADEKPAAKVALAPATLRREAFKMGPSLTKRHEYPGKLIIVEGIDGSGKSTQLDLLHTWLKSQDYIVFFTEWNSSELVKDTTKQGKKQNVLTPTTFSILHCIDFADRFSNVIMPPLKAGMIVLCDRYAYTAFARDAARGVNHDWVRNLYSFAVKPDLGFYFRVNVDTSYQRIVSARAKIKFHEAGMDLDLSSNIQDSFKIFQGRVVNEYDSMVDEFDLVKIDGTLDIDVQQKQMRKVVKELLKGYRQTPTLKIPLAEEDEASPTETPTKGL